MRLSDVRTPAHRPGAVSEKVPKPRRTAITSGTYNMLVSLNLNRQSHTPCRSTAAQFRRQQRHYKIHSVQAGYEYDAATPTSTNPSQLESPDASSLSSSMALCTCGGTRTPHRMSAIKRGDYCRCVLFSKITFNCFARRSVRGIVAFFAYIYCSALASSRRSFG